MLRLRDLKRFNDREKIWRRLVLYAKRVSPRLRWQEAGGFEAVWKIASERTLLDGARGQMLFQLARHASGLDGAFAEVGVYRGGTAKVLAHVADPADKALHLFDTFTGLPAPDARDLHAEGDFADTSVAAVQRFLAGHAAPRFHVGFFPETASGLEGERFSFVHVDVDIAPSAEACCAFFYPRLVPGGVLLFDDYGQTSCPGLKVAVDAFFADKPEPVLHLVTSQAVVLKT